jgi:hypothetical protein
VARFSLFGGFIQLLVKEKGVTFGAMESKMNKAVVGH